MSFFIFGVHFEKKYIFPFLTAKNLQNLHDPCWLHYCIRFRWQCDSLHIIFSQTSSVLILCSQPMKHFNPHCHDLSLGGGFSWKEISQPFHSKTFRKFCWQLWLEHYLHIICCPSKHYLSKIAAKFYLTRPRKASIFR